MQDNSKEIWMPRAICRALFRFKGRALTFFFLTIAVTVVGLIVCPRKYASEAKLFLRIGRESVAIDPTATAAGGVMGVDNSRESEINSVIEVITSRPILEKVVDLRRGGKPFSSPLERERAVRKLARHVNADSPKDTSVIVVTAEDDTPEDAQALVQAIVATYREEHMRFHRNSESFEFFNQQSAMLRGQLEEATARVRDAKTEYGFVSLEDRRKSLEEQIGALETEVRKTDSEISAVEAQVAAMRDSLDRLPADVVATLAVGDQSIVHLRRELFELQAREQALLSKRTEDHPEVIAAREQMRELKAIFNNEKVDRGAAMSTVVLKEESNLKSLLARKAKLAEQQSQLHTQLSDLNQQEQHVDQLKREADLLAANYKTYSESLEQSRVDQALKTEGITNVSEVQPASFEPKPSSPRKGRIMAMAGLLGLCGAFGLALLSEQLDQSLRFADDIERHLKLPLLASVPDMRTVPSV